MPYLYFMLRPKRVLSALFIFLTAGSVFGQLAKPIRIEGQTMGTTYSVIYFDSRDRNFQFSVDSLLNVVNNAISNYLPGSDVSMFNANEKSNGIYSVHFQTALTRSIEVARESDGNFDPTVMPLVNLWGFGPQKKGIPSQQKIDSIKNFIGYKHISIHGNEIVKDHPNVQVDFGGIGQGYGVDIICDFLRSKNIRHFLVELGGEGYASGRNLERETNWRVGLINPLLPEDEQQLIGYAIVEDEAFTTSGNYFNYRVIDGKKYGHTISPSSGFPIEHELISVSLFAPDCTTADAWDTAFLVAGEDKTRDFLERHSNLASVLIYMENGRPRIFISEKIKNKIFLDASYDH